MPAKEPKFEVPDQMREVAEKSVDQAQTAFAQFMEATNKAMDNFEGSTSAMQAGATNLGRQTLSFAEANVAATLEFARRMARAKDLEEMMQLQSQFMHGQMTSLGDHTRALTETASKIAADAAEKVTKG